MSKQYLPNDIFFDICKIMRIYKRIITKIYKNQLKLRYIY